MSGAEGARCAPTPSSVHSIHTRSAARRADYGRGIGPCWRLGTQGFILVEFRASGRGLLFERPEDLARRIAGYLTRR